ncbi:MAG: hypothetical protein QHH10_10935 [Peptococcaceae bacterium]|nr:hypothetical protein [Peptococcaceae bacterium]MDH7525814.1 hypothetical protein [Peptococcaceae bacterium]
MLLSLLMLIPLFWLLWCLTLDGANARYTSARVKMSLNRAVKGAVAAVNMDALAGGVVEIDEASARAVFDSLLRDNLNLNLDFSPAQDSPLLAAPSVLVFYVCQGPDYPYVFNTVMGLSYTFNNPGVLAVIRARCRHRFMGGFEQEIYAYSAAEIKR